MSTKSNKVNDMVLIAIFATIITVCSFIQIPFGPIPFTLQNFAVFLAAGMLGVKRGVLSVLVYIMLGIIGLPVFRGLGGIGVLIGPTGGFIIGFIVVAIIVGIAANKTKQQSSKNRFAFLLLAMLLGDAICVFLGCFWYMFVAEIGIRPALVYCVVPFIGPDILKIVLATIVVFRVKLPVNIE